ncbi:hypothetical protein B0H17DRAFT_910814, partial [Mycena rosella]
TDKDLPHRTALTDHIFKQIGKFTNPCTHMNDDQRAYGRIHFTGDVWSKGDLSSHFAIWTHFCMRDE